MDTIFKTVDDFILAIGRASTSAEISATLRTHLNNLGFERFAYWLVWPPEGPRAPFICHNYPTDWSVYYRDENLGAHDLVVNHAVKARCRPYKWQEITDSCNPTPQQKNVIGGAADAGLKAGASVPIFGPDRAQAILSVANDQSQEQFSRLFAEMRHALHLIATYTHERVLALRLYTEKQMNIDLTPREIDVLTLAARGKTRTEIARSLRIGEETVKSRLESSRRTLNAQNTAHAIAIAISNRLILT